MITAWRIIEWLTVLTPASISCSTSGGNGFYDYMSMPLSVKQKDGTYRLWNPRLREVQSLIKVLQRLIYYLAQARIIISFANGEKITMIKYPQISEVSEVIHTNPPPSVCPGLIAQSFVFEALHVSVNSLTSWYASSMVWAAVGIPNVRRATANDVIIV